MLAGHTLATELFFPRTLTTGASQGQPPPILRAVGRPGRGRTCADQFLLAPPVGPRRNHCAVRRIHALTRGGERSYPESLRARRLGRPSRSQAPIRALLPPRDSEHHQPVLVFVNLIDDANRPILTRHTAANPVSFTLPAGRAPPASSRCVSRNAPSVVWCEPSPRRPARVGWDRVEAPSRAAVLVSQLACGVPSLRTTSGVIEGRPSANNSRKEPFTHSGAPMM